jgi:hypothetical protein
LHRCVLNCTFSGTFSAQRSFRSIRLRRYLSSHAGAWQVKPDLKKQVPRMHCRSLGLPPEDHIPYQAWTSISRSSLVLLRNSTLALANQASPMHKTMPSSRTCTRSDRSWREINRRRHSNWGVTGRSQAAPEFTISSRAGTHAEQQNECLRQAALAGRLLCAHYLPARTVASTGTNPNAEPGAGVLDSDRLAMVQTSGSGRPHDESPCP